MIILPANTLAAGGFQVANSCRFNDGDSPSLHKSFSSASRTTYTISMWVKRSALASGALFYRYVDGNNYTRCFFEDDFIKFADVTSGADNWLLITNRKFRDVSSFYHIVVVCDTTNGTAGNRQRIYVNGSEETSFSTETNSSTQGQWGVDGNHYIGTNSGSSYFFDGYMAEVCYIDGSALTPSSFGEFDEDSPTIWKPKDVSGLTFGTNGFYLDFEDSSNLGNDANGGTDLTEANLAATDQSIDTPTNNFCVLNPLTKGSYITLSEGNLLSTGNSSTDQGSVYGTLSANSGKWYAEAKITVGGTASYPLVCISHINDQQYGSCTNGGNDDPGRHNTASGCYRANGDKRSNNVTSSSWGNSFDDDDIISVAIDCDNGATYVAKNGTWENSGDPTSGASKTGALVTWTPANEDMSTFSDSQYNSSSSNWNFGSPAFTISSGNADGNGYGNFEYSPPSGYLALCTKNLGSDGG